MKFIKGCIYISLSFLTLMTILVLPACTSSISEDEAILFEELASHIDFTENAINDELFSKPIYYYYIDGGNIGHLFSGTAFNRSRLKNSNTIAFVRSGDSQVGVWVDSIGRVSGYASINYVEVCFIDISEPTRRRVVFGESHPGQKSGTGTIYINGEKLEGTNAHWSKGLIFHELLKTIEE